MDSITFTLFEVLWHHMVYISSIFLGFILVLLVGTVLGLGIAYIGIFLLDYYVYDKLSKMVGPTAAIPKRDAVGRSDHNRWTPIAYPELPCKS